MPNRGRPVHIDAGVNALGDGNGAGSRKLCATLIYEKCKKDRCPYRYAMLEGHGEHEYDIKLYTDLIEWSSRSTRTRSDSPAVGRKKRVCKFPRHAIASREITTGACTEKQRSPSSNSASSSPT